jgi:hypothetical protein
MKEAECFAKCTAAVLDIDYDLECGPHTPDIIARKMKLLAELGFKRVQLIIPPPGFPNYNASSIFLNNNPEAHFHLQSVLNIGDPVFHYIKAARKYEMEVFAVIKPYEGGGSYTLPHGQKPLIPRNCLEQLGGSAFGFDNFIAQHPEMRVERKPIPDYEQLISKAVNKIELVFCLDQIRQKCTPVEYRTFKAVINKKPVENIRLWVSKDNGTYAPYEGNIQISEFIESRVINDINGRPLYEQAKNCRIVEISGITTHDDYFAVSFDNPNEQHVTLPYSMISLFAADSSEVPATMTSRVRTKPVITDDLRTCGGSDDFKDSGFEFQALDTIYCGNGWETHSCYGIAKGKLKYMKGTHCEAYPEVRAYWLEQVKHMLALGVDGVDIRLQCHSTGVVDFMNYGFNQPIIENFREKYKCDVSDSTDDYTKLMQIRGDFFEIFLQDAANAAKENGKKIQVHLQECYETQKLDYNFNDACFWAMPKILLNWKNVIDLADEITLKEYNWGCYSPSKANMIKDYARKMNKPLWVICYLQQGWDLNPEFCNAVNNDERIYGLQLYEVVCNKTPHAASQETNGIIGISPEGDIFLNKKTIDALKLVDKGNSK